MPNSREYHVSGGQEVSFIPYFFFFFLHCSNTPFGLWTLLIYFLSFFLSFLKNIYLSIWLGHFLVVACGI